MFQCDSLRVKIAIFFCLFSNSCGLFSLLVISHAVLSGGSELIHWVCVGLTYFFFGLFIDYLLFVVVDFIE